MKLEHIKLQLSRTAILLFLLYCYNYLPKKLVPKLVEAGARTYIKNERMKKSDDNLLQNYKTQKVKISNRKNCKLSKAK